MLILLFASTIWGSAFVAQSLGMDHVGPFTFQAVRTALGALTLIPVILIRDGIKKKKGEYTPPTPADGKRLIAAGLICGAALFVASNLQQIGIKYSTVAKAGFITALYIILVPVFGIVIGKKAGAHTFFCALIAAVGLYLICINGNFSLSIGDLALLGCAATYAVHILIIDRFAPSVDNLKLSFLQMIVAAALSAVMMLIFEDPSIKALLDAKWSLLYAGVLSSGVAFTLQIVAQSMTKPALSSLAMSLESVFSLLSGMLILRQIPTVREGIGCAVMFAAIITAQLFEYYPPKISRKKEGSENAEKTV